MTVQYGADHIQLTVADNSNGIPPAVVEKILDFRTRTSDKAAYRSPTRGAQGNALKTVIGIPIALGAPRLLVLHDCDPDGYNIARTLAEATRRMPDHDIEVVDLGLSLAAAESMGLVAETYTRKKALPQTLELTDAERAFFIVPTQGKHHVARRYELNALSAPQLIGLIEDGLRAQGADRKLMPPTAVIAGQADAVYAETLERHVRDVIDQVLAIDRLVAEVLQSLPPLVRLDQAQRWVERQLAADRALSWDQALKEAVAGAIHRQHPHIRRVVRAVLRGRP